MTGTEEEFLRTLRATFKVEAAEHLEAIGTGLLELEKAPAPAEQLQLIETVFRAAHSLKGAARAVGLTEVESFCRHSRICSQVGNVTRVCLRRRRSMPRIAPWTRCLTRSPSPQPRVMPGAGLSQHRPLQRHSRCRRQQPINSLLQCHGRRRQQRPTNYPLHRHSGHRQPRLTNSLRC